MIAVDCHTCLVAPSRYFFSRQQGDLSLNNLCFLAHGVADARRMMVETITVGESTYQLRRPAMLTFYPFVLNGEGEIVLEVSESGSVDLGIVGRGCTMEEASNNWAERLHTEIQTLLAKQDWERTTDEREQLAILASFIDLPKYLRDTPYRVRQIGEIMRRQPLPDKIRWEDGQLEHVSLGQMPAEFAAMHVGERFEAIVLRASGSGRLIKVLDISPLAPMQISSCEAREWEAIPTTKTASKVSWDELK